MLFLVSPTAKCEIFHIEYAISYRLKYTFFIMVGIRNMFEVIVAYRSWQGLDVYEGVFWKSYWLAHSSSLHKYL